MQKNPEKIGIPLFERNYEFLAWSASQLKGHGCWFFAKAEDGTCAKSILAWLGSFTDKVVAKRAARMGQALSSTTATLTVLFFQFLT